MKRQLNYMDFDDFDSAFVDSEPYTKQYQKVRKKLSKLAMLTEEEFVKYCKFRNKSYNEDDLKEVVAKRVNEILETIEL
jgi:hypothetical protein